MTSSCFQAPPVIPSSPSSLAGFWKIKPCDDSCFIVLPSLILPYPSNRFRTRKENSLDSQIQDSGHPTTIKDRVLKRPVKYIVTERSAIFWASQRQPQCHPYNHEMCHHWLTARKMKGWPVSDETKLSNDFGLCASWGVNISLSRLLSKWFNIAPAPRSSILNIFFCNFGLFAAILKRRGNRCWSSSHYYLPLVAVAPPLQEGLPPSPSSPQWPPSFWSLSSSSLL